MTQEIESRTDCCSGHSACSPCFCKRYPQGSTETLPITELQVLGSLTWKHAFISKGYTRTYILLPTPSLPAVWESEILAGGLCYKNPFFRKVREGTQLPMWVRFLSSEAALWCLSQIQDPELRAPDIVVHLPAHGILLTAICLSVCLEPYTQEPSGGWWDPRNREARVIAMAW